MSRPSNSIENTVGNIRTIYLPGAIPSDVATYYYEVLRDNIIWEDSIVSKKYKGPTRKAHSYHEQSPARHIIHELENFVGPQIMTAIAEQIPATYMDVLGCYLNYYINGEMFTPSHNHPGQNQIIISLGATRTLVLGGKKYRLQNGDIIIFGSQSHGVPKEPEVKDGRISIAIFTVMK